MCIRDSSRPEIYVISTPITGFNSSNENSSSVTILTLGVVISTLVFSIVDIAVAEAPKLMFSIDVYKRQDLILLLLLGQNPSTFYLPFHP